MVTLFLAKLEEENNALKVLGNESATRCKTFVQGPSVPPGVETEDMLKKQLEDENAKSVQERFPPLVLVLHPSLTPLSLSNRKQTRRNDLRICCCLVLLVHR